MNVAINIKLRQSFGVGEKLREAANLYHRSCVLYQPPRHVIRLKAALILAKGPFLCP